MILKLGEDFLNMNMVEGIYPCIGEENKILISTSKEDLEYKVRNRIELTLFLQNQFILQTHLIDITCFLDLSNQ